MTLKEIPEADKQYVGLLVSQGMKKAIDEACGRMGVTHSEFVRHAIMSAIQKYTGEVQEDAKETEEK